MLREINLIGKISAVRVRVITTEVLKQLAGAAQIDFDRLLQLCALDDSAGSDNWSDVKAIVAAFEFIFTQAVKHETDPEVLTQELQQLGMPKEHCDRLVRSYSDALPLVKQTFIDQRLSLPRLNSVDWQVDYVLSSDALLRLNEPTVQVKVALSTGKEHAFEMSVDKLRVLIGELKTARDLMVNLDLE